MTQPRHGRHEQRRERGTGALEDGMVGGLAEEDQVGQQQQAPRDGPPFGDVGLEQRVVSRTARHPVVVRSLGAAVDGAWPHLDGWFLEGARCGGCCGYGRRASSIGV
jgi:hypothetical protein